MPDIDGFQLAAMIRNHPRFEKTALIFISAILLTDVDRLRGYEMGAVDYVPVPVIPEVLRAKVKVFVELFRKTRQLEQLNKGLEARVAERTAELASSTLQLRQSERMRSLALAAGQMGSWEWNISRGSIIWDQGQCEIFGVDPSTFVPTLDSVRPLINPEDFELLELCFPQDHESYQYLPDGIPRPAAEWRSALVYRHGSGELRRSSAGLSGSAASPPISPNENAPKSVRSCWPKRSIIARATLLRSSSRSCDLTRADSIDEYIGALDGRIGALSNAHRLLAGSRWEGADLHSTCRRRVCTLSRERQRTGQGSRTDRSAATGHRSDHCPRVA